jgi:DNA integrity scanning protein DisA with diadenylate cyclase activity
MAWTPYNSFDNHSKSSGNHKIYKICKQFLFMTSTNVYSIRLHKDVRQMMDEMDDINWQEEIRRLVETKVRETNKQRILLRAEKRLEKMVENKIGAAMMIREDRDAR